jgi:hypothetical protein
MRKKHAFIPKIAMVSAVLVGIATIAAGCTEGYDYKPVDVGKDGSARPLKAKSNAQFIRGTYADVLGRTPETYDFEIDANGTLQSKFQIDEQSTLVTVLDGVGDPAAVRNLVAAGLVDSSEVELPTKADVDATAFVTDTFHQYLGREPSTYELDAFVRAWNEDPAVDPKVVVRAILASREYESN